MWTGKIAVSCKDAKEVRWRKRKTSLCISAPPFRLCMKHGMKLPYFRYPKAFTCSTEENFFSHQWVDRLP